MTSRLSTAMTFLALTAIFWAAWTMLAGCVVVRGDASVLPKAPSVPVATFSSPPPPSGPSSQPIAPAGTDWNALLAAAGSVAIVLADRRIFHGKQPR